jgi:uncharacterized protein (DUF58 family)
MAAKFKVWAADWAERRQGSDALGTTLKRRRIYILPTRFGLVFGALVFAMLLGSLNYAASLGFALTFLLTGLGLVVMHHCHNNLLGAQLRFAGAPAVFAGQDAHFKIGLHNAAGAARYEVELNHEGRNCGPVDIEAGQSAALEVATPAQRRGWLKLRRFAVATRHPAYLFRAWTWVHMEAQCLVYPMPAPPGRPLPESAEGDSPRSRPAAGDSDFAGLRPAVRGDPLGRIAWKAYARNGELLLKQFSSGDEQPRMLDWDSLPDLDTEARLSQLTRWCLDAAARTDSFGLRLPNAVIPLGRGNRHLSDCLRALALYEPGRPA